MKIKEFVKKNKQAIKIVGVVSGIVITGRIIYAVGTYNGLVYATRNLAKILTEEELATITKRLIVT